ncbi:MAG TPA: ABC transporter ATP-binding protein, partial [Mesotoga sp.]|nr:ABC transporter ATP-binding protein [Mesotoga sp.]
MSETVLSLNGFTLSVSGENVLEDVTLDIPGGSIALVQGVRGSGKSALMRSFIHLNEELFDNVSFTGSIRLFG